MRSEREEAGQGTLAAPARPLRAPWWVLLLALAHALWLVPDVIRRVTATSHPALSWTTGDVDTWLIREGLLRAPDFADTLRWWTGPWVGQVPFYRPLTSYVFWVEWKAFGEREWLYVVPTATFHLMATLLFAALVYRVAERRGFRLPGVAAVAGAWAFTGLLYFPGRGIVAGSVMQIWKNQPDTLAALCCFAALLCYLRAQEPGEGGRRRWSPLLGAVLWYLAGCGFKEIAVPLPAVCAVLELDALRGKERAAALRRLGTMAAAAALFLTVRFLAIGGMGYTYGSNREWLRRSLLEVLGPFGWAVVNGDWLGLGMVVWALLAGFAAWRLRGRRGLLTASLAGVAAVAVGWSLLGVLYRWSAEGAAAERMPPADELVTGLLLCFTPASTYGARASLLFLGPILLLWARHRPMLALGLVWMLAFVAPLVFSPGPVHRYYLPEAGYLLVYGLGIATAASLLLDCWRRFPWKRASPGFRQVVE